MLAKLPLDLTIQGIFFLFMIACLLGFFATRGSRQYLLYLALAFGMLAMSLRFQAVARLIALGIALVSFVLAMIDGVQATKARVVRHRQELREREEAFAEYMTELARIEAESVPSPATPGTDEPAPSPAVPTPDPGSSPA